MGHSQNIHPPRFLSITTETRKHYFQNYKFLKHSLSYLKNLGNSVPSRNALCRLGSRGYEGNVQ